jgi:hypothetical protein
MEVDRDGDGRITYLGFPVLCARAYLIVASMTDAEQVFLTHIYHLRYVLYMRCGILFVSGS